MPSGSIRLWHEAQAGSARCCSKRVGVVDELPQLGLQRDLQLRGERGINLGVLLETGQVLDLEPLLEERDEGVARARSGQEAANLRRDLFGSLQGIRRRGEELGVRHG